MSDSFVHLHNHTEFSMLDGAARIDDLFEEAARLGMPAVAISDHGHLYGTFDFSTKAKAKGVKAILGIEAYVAPGSRFEKKLPNGMERKKTDKYSHMTLLAETDEGFRNLSKLASLASLEGYYYEPRIDRELMRRHHKGIIALSGCVGGEIAQHILHNQYEEAKKAALDLQEIFGKGNFFIEIMRHSISIEKKVEPGLLRLAEELDIPLVATNDLHYVKKGDAHAHDALLCIQTSANISDPDRFKFESQEFYLKSPEEMRKLFADIPQACDNTLLIAERCNAHIETGKKLLPQYPVPEGHDQESYFRERVESGLHRRYGETIPTHVRERADYEVDIITSMGWPAYFSIVEDLVRHAKEVGIQVGPGRGSAAGSMVAYALGITGLDPIEHGLLFERFLNPERVSMPDIDIDFDDRRRSEMIDYSVEKYGEERVAQIVTYGSIKAKQAVKDAARVLGKPYSVGDRLTKLMPPMIMGKDMALKDCFNKESSRYSEAMEMREAYQNDPEAKEVLDTALGIEGLKRQVGVHAAGVIIGGDPLMEHLPLWRRVQDGAIITQYDMRSCEKIGLLKMDFLGLRNLTVMDDAIRNIKRNRGETVDLEKIGLGDEPTYQMLREGDAIGVFQLESGPMRSLMKAISPTSFNDVSALIALYRPGPMGANAHIDYADRKNGRKPVTPIHEEFKETLAEILDETFGIICYQEQVMAVAQKVAGYSLGQADLLRRAMGKKDKSILDKEYGPFSEGARKNGYSKEAIKVLWDILVPFADYAFNKSHSAAYGVISYWTAYLKKHYPAEYMAALLTSVRDDKDKLGFYLHECRRMGITVLSPDVNESDFYFTPAGKHIRFGLGAVRGVGEGVVELIVKAREEKGAFENFEDYVKKTDQAACNKRVIDALIKAGAFDSFKHSRLGLTLVCEEIISGASRAKKSEAVGQFDLFSSLGMEVAHKVEIPTVEWDNQARLAFEREMLGLYVSAHPLDGVDLSHESPMPIPFLSDDSIVDGDEVRLAGLLTNVEHKVSKAGKHWASAILEDKDGSVPVMFFSKTYEGYKDFLRNDAILVVAGRVDKSRDDDGIKILAQGVRKPLDAPEQGESVDDYTTMVIVLEAPKAEARLVSEVKSALKANPGAIEVEVEMPDGKRFKVPGHNCSGNYPARMQIKEIQGVKEINFL